MTTLSVDETASAAMESLDHRHLVHPHHTKARSRRQVFVRGRGTRVWDADGEEYLDMMGGGNWLAQVGHAHPDLVAAGAGQLERLEYFSCWREYSNEPAVRLAARIAALAPRDLDRVFFTTGGSDATDTAIKVARRYFHEIGQPERTWIIGRDFGYHGCTLGSGSVTGFSDMHHGVGPTMPHVVRVSPPMTFRTDAYGGADPTAYLLDELERTIDRIGAHRIAAMIGEPVMGGAGVVVPPAGYWPAVRQLLRDKGILLIADEVITGFGRLGHWFASEPYGMEADLIVTAKGLTSGYAPLGAVLIRDDIAQVLTTTDTHFFHGQTYFGHPLACALGLATIDVLERDHLLDRVPVIESWFRRDWAALSDHPAVGDVRMAGAMIGVELVADPATREPVSFEQAVGLVDRMRTEHRVLVRDYGPTIVFGPALVSTREDVTQATSALLACLSQRTGRH